ncbi:hypothetical protein [Streptomyces gardneri]|uniref:hypothetical protein n=1 Tax=Streptomyces gardneri TaxID=66892 RepID=UPI0035D5AC55
MAQTVDALSRGATVRIRCATRFRNSGGGRQRAYLTVRAKDAFVSTADGTVPNVRLGAPGTNLEIIAELSMIVCDVAGRQLEVLLPAGEELLLQAVTANLSAGDTEHSATRNGDQRSVQTD